jgi:hypothetical protein
MQIGSQKVSFKLFENTNARASKQNLATTKNRVLIQYSMVII